MTFDSVLDEELLLEYIVKRGDKYLVYSHKEPNKVIGKKIGYGTYSGAVRALLTMTSRGHFRTLTPEKQSQLVKNYIKTHGKRKKTNEETLIEDTDLDQMIYKIFYSKKLRHGGLWVNAYPITRALTILELDFGEKKVREATKKFLLSHFARTSFTNPEINKEQVKEAMAKVFPPSIGTEKTKKIIQKLERTATPFPTKPLKLREALTEAYVKKSDKGYYIIGEISGKVNRYGNKAYDTYEDAVRAMYSITMPHIEKGNYPKLNELINKYIEKHPEPKEQKK
jgi:hypothetical protein